MDVLHSYINLSHLDKINKLKHLMEIFSPYSIVAQQTLGLIDKHSDQLTDDEMVRVYGLFIKAIQDNRSDNLQEAILQLQTIQERLEEIQRREELDKQGENVDTLLANI